MIKLTLLTNYSKVKPYNNSAAIVRNCAHIIMDFEVDNYQIGEVFWTFL